MSGAWRHHLPGLGRSDTRPRADETGLHPGRLGGSFEVCFDGRPVWTVTVPPGRRGGLVRWPRAMRPWLDGTAELSLRPVGANQDGPEIDLGEVTFGSGSRRVDFVDKQGLPVVIDKWGIVQRPFSTRGPEVGRDLAVHTEQVIAAIREETGIETWLAFGTLLGAARSGRAIGHDSDVDLLYLSASPSPVHVNREMYEIRRALHRRGYHAVLKSGSFVTVLVQASDGAPLGIDVYACFYVDDLLHETATVRARIPREAVLPLGSIEFEGVALPAPADPDALLTASYGPDWRTPDPSFRHTPGPEITDRFDAWFGALMTNRRAWESWWREHQGVEPPSALARQILADTSRAAGVVDLGAGNGSDAVQLARSGRRVVALEYARPALRHARPAADGHGRLRTGRINLYDARDVMTCAALERRSRRRPEVVLARFVLDAIEPRATRNFWRFSAMLLRGGGRLYLEFEDSGRPAGRRVGTFANGAARYAVECADVRADVESSGGTVLAAERAAPDPAEPNRPETWRLVVGWP